MLRRGLRLHTWQSQGYWNDVGSCDAYRATCRDVLDGRFPLPLPEGKKLPVQEPCWISPEAVISPDCQLGPYTVIGSGSCIGSGCRISGSVLDGAFLQADCTVEDSILSRGVHLGREVQLRPGCVLAEEVSVGAGSLLRETLRIWPGLTLSAGNVFAEDQLHGPKTRLLRFQTGGIIAGENGLELTPERFLRMGRSCAGERIGVSAAGGSFARLLAEAFLIGAGADGKTSFLLDAPLPAAAAATAGSYGLDQCLFFLQEVDRSVIYCFDRDGLPIPRKDQRKMEASLSAAEGVFPTLRSCSSEQLTGSEEVYLADVLRACGSLKGWKVSCPSITFRRWLARTGTELCAPEDGVLQLKFAEDGFTLSVVDELGRDWPWSMLLCAMAAAELRCGEESVVLPYDAPHLAERVAEEENGTVYRLDRDGEDARKHWRRTPWCRDGLTLTMRLLSRLKAMGLFHLSAFMDTLPEYHSLERVVRLDGIDTAVLRMLSRDREAETVNGVLLRRGEATASVRRQGGGDLRILAESVSMEAAEAFCDNIQRRIRQMGSETQA